MRRVSNPSRALSHPSPSDIRSETLPRPLLELLESLTDRAFATRLRQVYLAAARAIARLQELDLDKDGGEVESGAPDLSLWESVAPVIRDTVVDVNTLLDAIRTHFPTEVPGGIAEMIGNAIEETGIADPVQATEQRRMDEAVQQIHTLTSVLASEITNLGERMRSPQVVSDRWNLLAELQYFRGKFRSVIGDLIFLSANNLGEVTREEVIPEWLEDVRTAIELRRGVTDLARLLTLFTHRVQASPPDGVRASLDDLARALDAFGRSKPYAGLRAQDKRRIVGFRAAIDRLRERETTTASEATEVLSEFAQFVECLSDVNRRDCLVQNDRAVLASCCVKLENAESMRLEDPVLSAQILAEAVREAGDLYGREPKLDGYLRKARKRDLSVLSETELGPEIELVRELFANAMLR